MGAHRQTPEDSNYRKLNYRSALPEATTTPELIYLKMAPASLDW